MVEITKLQVVSTIIPAGLGLSQLLGNLTNSSKRKFSHFETEKLFKDLLSSFMQTHQVFVNFLSLHYIESFGL